MSSKKSQKPVDFPCKASEEVNTKLNVNTLKKYIKNMYLTINGLSKDYEAYKKLSKDEKKESKSSFMTITNEFNKASTLYIDTFLHCVLKAISSTVTQNGATKIKEVTRSDVRSGILNNMELRHLLLSDLEMYDENIDYQKMMEIKEDEFYKVQQSVDENLKLSDKAQNIIIYLVNRTLSRLVKGSLKLVEKYCPKKKQLSAGMLHAVVHILHLESPSVTKIFDKKFQQLMKNSDKEESTKKSKKSSKKSKKDDSDDSDDSDKESDKESDEESEKSDDESEEELEESEDEEEEEKPKKKTESKKKSKKSSK